MNIITKAASVLIILLSSNTVSATIIDNGDYTTVNGVDWLDWSLTANMTQSDALAQHTSYRTATLNEVISMMSTMWDRTFNFDPDGVEEYVPHYMDDHYVSQFNQLFSGSFNNFTPLARTDEIGYSGYTGPVWFGGHHLNYSPSGVGIALVRTNMVVQQSIAFVRTNVVPEPPVLTIFALGLMALVSRRFKKN